jgi:hypothetical protein
MTTPQPLIAADGTPLCQASCPHFEHHTNWQAGSECKVVRERTYEGKPCRPAVAAMAAENERLRNALEGAIVDYDKCPYQMATDEIERLRLVSIPELPGFFYVLDREAVDAVCRREVK